MAAKTSRKTRLITRCSECNKKLNYKSPHGLPLICWGVCYPWDFFSAGYSWNFVTDNITKEFLIHCKICLATKKTMSGWRKLLPTLSLWTCAAGFFTATLKLHE